MPGAPGASSRRTNNEPADFSDPRGAVDAFLDALDAKDITLLSEATALRAATEATPKNQKMFSSIIDQSMTEDDLSQLADKLEGFKIVGENQAVSSGRVGITIGKSNDKGDRLTRTVTVRHEKAGWKVLDISGQGVLKNPYPNRNRNQRRTR